MSTLLMFTLVKGDLWRVCLLAHQEGHPQSHALQHELTRLMESVHVGHGELCLSIVLIGRAVKSTMIAEKFEYNDD